MDQMGGPHVYGPDGSPQFMDQMGALSLWTRWGLSVYGPDGSPQCMDQMGALSLWTRWGPSAYGPDGEPSVYGPDGGPQLMAQMGGPQFMDQMGAPSCHSPSIMSHSPREHFPLPEPRKRGDDYRILQERHVFYLC